MLKKYSILDILFFAVCWIFILLSVYEWVQLISPYYTYLRALVVFIVLSICYIGYYSLPHTQASAHPGSEAPLAERNNIRTYIARAHRYSDSYKESAVYLSFSLLATLIILSQIYSLTVLTVYAIIIFVAIFIYAKILWFRTDTVIKKSKLSSLNTLRFFLILYAVFFGVLHYIFERFSVPEENQFLLYCIISALYLISGYIIFFDYSSLSARLSGFVYQKLLRPYSIAMGIIIMGLGGYLILKNDILEQVQEWAMESQVWEVIDEWITQPGIIIPQNQAESIDDPGNVEYETVQVSEIYDIQPGLELWSIGQGVVELQTVLWNLQYFLWEVNGEFGEDTRTALTQALQVECAWPESTRGIFWPQAKECIDSLEISRKTQVPVLESAQWDTI